MQKKIITGDALRGSEKVNLDDELKDAPVVAYYFSAHWCPPCRNFTPKLVEKYKEWNKDGKKIEVVFMSFDQDEDQFKEYFGTMPWLAIPHGDSRIDQIAAKYKANSIPRLVIVDKDENALTDKGVQDLHQSEAKAVDNWKALYK
mmetsp:Transcript_2531/g.2158  ORF Transcript_2531/g.2158 Transcript_2531/m.2158 type:complete len:145 (+) Transcript_2531:107-541(+)